MPAPERSSFYFDYFHFRKEVAMLSNFRFAFDAVMPMLILIGLGYWLHRRNYFDASALKKMNNFVFTYGIPFLMFNNVYMLDRVGDIPLELMGFVLISLVIITTLCLGVACISTKQKNQRGVIMQVGFRSNFAVIGAAMAAALGGAEGSKIAASLQAPGIIYFNIAAVVCLSAFSEKPNSSINVKAILKNIITNPLIIGLFAGTVCLLLREIIPRNGQGSLIFSLSGNLPSLYSAINSLAKMSTPLVLVLLGAQIDFHSVAGMRRKVVIGTALRLIVVPAVGFGLALWAQRIGVLVLTPAIVSALLAFYGAPVAVAGAVMAEEMGGDGALARQYVVWTTTLSLFTLFGWIVLLRTMGML